MAADKASADHVEHPEHEAALTGALALANLFSNCVEAFGLILAHQKWEHEEQLLLSRLGIQQARLLIWGDIVGISSPPKSVTDRAIPQHPSSAYPDLNEPTFFQARDVRLEDPENRTTIESALSAIVDRSSNLTREEMMNKYGLKPPKRFSTDHQPALDTNRLEAFREKFELLKEVGEEYAQINTRRASSIVHTAWTIAEQSKFAGYIALIKDKVDFLITMMDAKERVDRAMRMDIRALGWHLSADRNRVAQDTSKLRLVQEACLSEYPEYVEATQQALENIRKDSRENASTYKPYAAPVVVKPSTPPVSMMTGKTPQTNGSSASSTPSHEKAKRPSVFGGLFKSLRKSHNDVHKATRTHQDLSATTESLDPPRSQSDAGPVSTYTITNNNNNPNEHDEDGIGGAPLEPIRSKSVGAILEQPAISGIDEEIVRNRLEKLGTNNTVPDEESLPQGSGLDKHISRHDQYHGIGRVATKDLRQGNAVYE